MSSNPRRSGKKHQAQQQEQENAGIGASGAALIAGAAAAGSYVVMNQSRTNSTKNTSRQRRAPVEVTETFQCETAEGSSVSGENLGGLTLANSGIFNPETGKRVGIWHEDAPLTITFPQEQFWAQVSVYGVGSNQVTLEALDGNGKVLSKANFGNGLTDGLMGDDSKMYNIRVDSSEGGIKTVKLYNAPWPVDGDFFSVGAVTASCIRPSHDVCNYNQFTVLPGPYTVDEAEKACQDIGKDFAIITDKNYLDAATAAYKCSGPSSRTWVDGYYTKAELCLAMNTNVGFNPATGQTASLTWPGECETTKLPVMCHVPEEPLVCGRGDELLTGSAAASQQRTAIGVGAGAGIGSAFLILAGFAAIRKFRANRAQ